MTQMRFLIALTSLAIPLSFNLEASTQVKGASMPSNGADTPAIQVDVASGDDGPKPPELISEAELWQEYYGWRAADDIEKAHEVASQLVLKSDALHGNESIEFGRSLAEVGVTEVLLGRHGDALRNLTAAEAILKKQAPLYSEKLLSAMTYLGSALQSHGHHRDAIQAFSRAQHLTHRLWGTNNMAQVRISYAKADSYQAMGDFKQAEELQRHAMNLHRENFGMQSPEAISASARFGTWLRSTGDYHGSIHHFSQALGELQGKGPDLPESFPLLNGLAHAYRGGYRGKYARGTHKRILAMMAASPDRFTLDQRIEAHLDFGDWLMQRYYERRAVQQYEAAWALADSGGEAGFAWVEEFSKPKMVRYGGMAPHDIDGDNRYVTFKFDLTADGRTRRVKVTEYDCDGREQYDAKRSFPEEIRYRPAIEGGRAVARSGHMATMYLLAPGTLLEPEPVAAPNRKSPNLFVADLLFEPSDIPITEPQKDDR